MFLFFPSKCCFQKIWTVFEVMVVYWWDENKLVSSVELFGKATWENFSKPKVKCVVKHSAPVTRLFELWRSLLWVVKFSHSLPHGFRDHPWRAEYNSGVCHFCFKKKRETPSVNSRPSRVITQGKVILCWKIADFSLYTPKSLSKFLNWCIQDTYDLKKQIKLQTRYECEKSPLLYWP